MSDSGTHCFAAGYVIEFIVMTKALATYWEDHLEIRSLIVRERYYRDTGQWSKLRGAYHPDASKTKVRISW